ncbi:hypothetical protein ACFY1C_36465 [Streptomyces sp. NPDC001279]|uniref:hypothetical protein n=1 Tax=Streptomyces sp. NPDC001279 TaxID=3364556 RepID=UPI00368948ED
MPEERGVARVWVYARQFYVVDPELGTDQAPDISDASNGLIAVAEDGAGILTGLTVGPVEVTVTTHQSEPPLEGDWDEVVETSFTSSTGSALVTSWEDGGVEDLPDLAAAGPGSYRMRVHARGRDAGRVEDSLGPDDDPVEMYLLQAWPAPAADEQVIRQTDQVGTEWRQL